MSDSVLISLISATTGVVIAYITKKVRTQFTPPKAKDRIDTAFDMYDGVIKRQDTEIQRQHEIILRLEAEVRRLEKERS